MLDSLNEVFLPRYKLMFQCLMRTLVKTFKYQEFGSAEDKKKRIAKKRSLLIKNIIYGNDW